MRNQTLRNIAAPKPQHEMYGLTIAPDLMRVQLLAEKDQPETLNFLNERPVHTVVMTSFILDNGIQNELNRGEYYGYRNAEGKLEGVALIGHTTLVEACTPDALKALAFAARGSKTPIHLVMSNGDDAEVFWGHLTGGTRQPRLTCIERLFELSFPFPVPAASNDLRHASLNDLIQVAEAQGEIAFMESGVNPMDTNREGFLKRVARRIEQGRVFVVVKDGKLVFKADIIAETTDTAYLEGVYVAPEYRGKGIGSGCLAQLSCELMDRFRNICLLSNIEFEKAHASYGRAGYRSTGQCTTLFA